MKYIVKQSTLENYLNLKISDQKLFPIDAPVGTSFYDLVAENNNSKVVRFEHVENAIKMYLNQQIDFQTFSEWIDSIIALELFRFDDSSDLELDKVAGLVYSIDDIKEDKEEVDSTTLNNLLMKYKSLK